MKKYISSTFVFLALVALFFACSKKNDGVVTFVVDKTTSTTGAYSGSNQLGAGSTTAATAGSATTASTTASTSSTGNTTASSTGSTSSTTAFNIPCSPGRNSATFPDGKYPTENYSVSSDNNMGYYQLMGSAGQEQIQIMFHDADAPTENRIYTTVDVPQSSDEVTIAFNSYRDNVNYWSNLGQQVYVTVDPNTHAVSVTLCDLDLRSYQPSSGTYVHTHITGNFTR